MSNIRKFKTALVEAMVPLMRKRLNGKEVTEEEARKRIEYQLENRGFELDTDE